MSCFLGESVMNVGQLIVVLILFYLYNLTTRILWNKIIGYYDFDTILIYCI